MKERMSYLRSGSCDRRAIGMPVRVANHMLICFSDHIEGCRTEYTHVVDGSPWHASQALMRLYRTVLHLHKSPSSGPLGPLYEFPGSRAGIINAE